jgi:hypothetical protein
MGWRKQLLAARLGLALNRHEPQKHIENKRQKQSAAILICGTYLVSVAGARPLSEDKCAAIKTTSFIE